MRELLTGKAAAGTKDGGMMRTSANEHIDSIVMRTIGETDDVDSLLKAVSSEYMPCINDLATYLY